MLGRHCDQTGPGDMQRWNYGIMCIGCSQVEPIVLNMFASGVGQNT
jgi:hypothetical protein